MQEKHTTVYATIIVDYLSTGEISVKFGKCVDSSPKRNRNGDAIVE